ncbi:MAG: single-stranded DNA-binding protein [Eubacteriales bacterium]|nr:single-stranded DNA-binding protein [Eubacteriales bacterium]
MDTEKLETNQVTVRGRVCQAPVYSHSMYAEKFYDMRLSVPRLSGICDVLPVTVSDRLLDLMALAEGDDVTVLGQLRSYNHMVDSHSRLILTVFARHICPCAGEEEQNPNQVVLDGFLCRTPIYRTTPFGREIADMLLAVNRAYSKSDYIPAIAWGRNARYVQRLEVGRRVLVHGRMQSREYEKKLDGGETQQRTAYEVSVSSIEAFPDE